jgi:membrane protein
VFVELQNALNVIWKARTSAGSGLFLFLRTRLISFGLILAIGFVLMVSLALNAAFSAVGAHLATSVPAFEVALHAANVALSLAVTVLLLAAIYKFMPDVRVASTDAWLGAAVTAALLAVGKFAIGFYIGRAHLASSYGGASALITILLWVYYSSLIVLFGAELTKAHAGEREGG